MKKSLILTILLSMFFAASANPVDVKTAKEIGAKFLKASTNVKANSELKLVKTYSIDRGDAAFYVFNAEKGFVIVAADDCATPILAYSDEGIFDVNNIPVQFEEYLEGFVEQIQYGIENILTGDEKTSKQWDLVKTIGRLNENRNTTVVEPLLTSIWHQNSYYNDKCPVDVTGPNGHVFAGCVATAMGQIMYKYKKPLTGNSSHTYIPMSQENPNVPSGYPEQTANFGTTTYDWDHMPDELTSTSTAEQVNAVATLLWHCGVAVDMHYGVTYGSGAYSILVPDAMKKYFRYSNEMSVANRDTVDNTVWLARVKASLDLGRPLYYSGTHVANNGSTSGHAFVCDGYDANDMIHMNWGWSGNCNNYVAVSVVQPNGSSYKFKYGNFAIFNIHPSDDGITTTHTISVSSNNDVYGTVSGGGSYNNGTEVTVTATPNIDFVFSYWSEGGAVVSTKASYTFEALYSRNLTAVFAELNSITISASVLNNTGGSVSGGGGCDYGDKITVTAAAAENYTFCYWLENNTIVSTSPSYEFTVTGDRSLVARFAPTSSVCELTYYFVDTYGDGWQGNTLNVKYENTYTETMELAEGASASFTRNVIDGGAVKLTWTLGMYISECQFALKRSNGEVFYEKREISKDYSYTFNMDCDGGSDYTFNGTDSSLWSLASNWASSNKPGTTAVVGINHNVTVDENATIGTLNLYENKTLTITSGVTLTVTGTLVQMSGANIIIEHGGQLVNATEGITGTVKKAVAAWTTDPSENGWYAISTPIYNISFANVANLTNATSYNVYRYDEASMTWENCEDSHNAFDAFANGRGYLYRRSEAETLEFTGAFNTSYAEYQLSYSAANNNLKGFHLIGNPFTHNIYKGEGTAIANTYLEDGFYTLQTNGTWLAGTDKSTAIAPCQAILVQAKNTVTDEKLAITKTTSSGTAKETENTVRFSVYNDNYNDVAYAVIKEGEGLNKIAHRNEEAPMIYIKNNDANYAIADLNDGITAFDLCFKAATTGKYTLKVSADGNFSYLHIIDRFTGEDVDMLAENDYSFIASSQDSENRFSVLLERSDNSENSVFAYQNGDQIIVNGEGTLQVIDLMGRIVATTTISGVTTINASSLQSHVYIFRLLGKDVKTQKIVIE